MNEETTNIPKTVPLSEMSDGEEGVIRSLQGGRALTSRLAGLGIILNAPIKVIRGGKGPVMVEVANSRVALGHGEADKIMVSPGAATECFAEEPPRESRSFLIALAGQPNVGKSTVFNILTGLSQQVGNWPGKTVEKKEGRYVCGDVELRIVDLPGTYSLTAASEEERVARNFILEEKPDLVVLFVNAAALERSLYLLTELLLLSSPVIVAVNMIDVADAQGIRINTAALENSLGIPVIAMTATKNRGIQELVDRLIAFLEGNETYHPHLPEVAPNHRGVFREVAAILERHLQPAGQGGAPWPISWLAVKLMEGDPEISAQVESVLPPPAWSRLRSIFIKHEDALQAVVGGRYDWIEAATRASVQRFRMGQVVLTDRIDHILTRPLFGIPILLAVFGGIFTMTYVLGYPLQRGLEWLIKNAASGLEPYTALFPPWLRGLVLDCVLGGVGSVVTLLPVLIIFFAAMAFLEDVGYMARAAFVLDRFMHFIGLHGKSAIPMCLGFGCNVSAVLGARIVESKKERLLTVFLSPFIPCTARLAVLTFVSAAVFPRHATLVTWSLLTVNILILGLVGMTVQRVFLKGEPLPFIMELPLYHRPNPRVIGMVIWTRTWEFVKRAGTVILGVSVVVWLMSYLPTGRVDDSILASFGRLMEPVGRLIGLDWKMITALITSVIAKENAVATLAVLHGVGREGLASTLSTVVPPASALSFLTVLMLFIPCVATTAVMKREMGSGKWFGAFLALMLALSAVGGFIAHRIGMVVF